MRKIITRSIPSTLSFLFFFIVGSKALADDPFGLKGAASGTGVSTAELTGQGSIISVVIFNLLGIVGVIFLILMIWGGTMWMTSGGNEKRVGTAKSILTTAVIGLVIVLMAYSITYFIVQNLTAVQGPASAGSGSP